MTLQTPEDDIVEFDKILTEMWQSWGVSPSIIIISLYPKPGNIASAARFISKFILWDWVVKLGYTNNIR